MRLVVRDSMNILTVAAMLTQLAKDYDLEIVLEGTPDSNLAMRTAISQVFEDWAVKPRFVKADAPLRPDPAAGVMAHLEAESFDVTWGPNSGRPAGYYVSIPNYNGGQVVSLDTVRRALYKE